VQKQKLTILFTVFVDVLGFGIVIPILPFYVGSFGASALTITLLFASFAFFAFLSSPFLGALSDRVGRRPVLLVSIFSTAVGWFVFAGANSLPLLFLGRIIDGAAAGNFTIAQSYLVDLSKDEKDRTANLGLMSAVFGVGFTVGPMLGGLLSTVSHAFPFWFAGILALLNTAAAYVALPETHYNRSTTALSFNPLRPIARAAYDTKLRPLYVAWILFALAFTITQAVYALYAERALGLDSFSTGVLFTLSGIFMVLNQALLLKRFWLARFDELTLEAGMLTALGLGLLMMSVHTLWLFLIGSLVLAIAQSTLRVVVTSRAAGTADPKMKGEIIGVLTSLFAAAMVVGPVLGGVLFEVYSSLPFLAGFIFMIVAFFVSHRGKLEQRRNQPPP
jgi:DHA1 family tetracycline resistance protein-like MFS transporter